jgi:hypothetical protein
MEDHRDSRVPLLEKLVAQVFGVSGDVYDPTGVNKGPLSSKHGSTLLTIMPGHLLSGRGCTRPLINCREAFHLHLHKR